MFNLPVIGTYLLKKGIDFALGLLQKRRSEFKELVISKLNEKIDIPKMDEAEEANFYGHIYDACEEAIEAILRN